MERRLYPKNGHPVKIVRFLDRNDRGVEIETEKFVSIDMDNVQTFELVTRFYPWTSVAYIETV